MKRLLAISILSFTIVFSALGFCQQPTMARLNHGSVPDITHATNVPQPAASPAPQRRTAMLSESALSRVAARALFVNSDPGRAGLLAKQALRRDSRDAEALFVQMESAGIAADQTAMLDAALRLCELGGASSDDPRVQLAAVRIRESAANSEEFRRALPRVQSLLATSSQLWPDLQYALLNAAMDGVPGPNPYAVSRAAGILTDWRIAGPLGRHSPLDFDQDLTANSEDLVQSTYKGRPVENFEFPDGRIVLPDYLPHRGIFYAVGQFAVLTAGNWTISAEGSGRLEVYVDGRPVLRGADQDASRAHESASFDATPGPHRVLLRFAPSATPLRISVWRTVSPSRSLLRARISVEEAAYQLAAERYAAGEFGSAIKQMNAVPSAGDSAPLQYLLAQALDRQRPTASESATAWHKLLALAPAALSADQALARRALKDGDPTQAAKLAERVLALRSNDAAALETLTAALSSGAVDWTTPDEADLWTRRLAARRSCEALEAATEFYRSRSLPVATEAAQQRLEGCAPESPAYAQSLSQQGNHMQSAEALQRLVAAAPLNRTARAMLVRELQLAGEDAAAQHAAAEWLRTAPNAENYHRLAAGNVDPAPQTAEFYLAYRRDAMAAAREGAHRQFAKDAVVLLDDHVAIARQDGSISLYVHTATLALNRRGIDQLGNLKAPLGAQVLQSRIIHSDGIVESFPPAASKAADSFVSDDVIDEEYVVNYAGDGGIPEHSEAFQFVFGSFDRPVLSARFVALTPAEHADGGVVITTGQAPPMGASVHDGMLARVWQKDAELNPNDDAMASTGNSPAIVRIVEQENGWAVPSNAEHQRRIDTIHPGPRLEDSSMPIWYRWPRGLATTL
ncbi:MAG: hypothetical protein WA655_15245 [Candidatus Korobacteraceae bacterium]